MTRTETWKSSLYRCHQVCAEDMCRLPGGESLSKPNSVKEKKDEIILPPLPPGITLEDLGRAVVKPIKKIGSKNDD